MQRMSDKTKKEEETTREKRHIRRRRKKRLRKKVSRECPECGMIFFKELRHKPDGGMELFWPTRCNFCSVKLRRRVEK